MFNKTIRSVLSLALAFCLLLGMSGNAIAMAVSNPVDGALGQVDTKVYGTIDELNATIDELEDVIDEMEFVTLPNAIATLADAEIKLKNAEKELATLTAAEGDVTVANNKLADAKAKLAEAKDMLEGEKLAELRQTAYDKAFEQFSDMVADAEADAWKQFEEAVGKEYKTQSEKLQKALDDAKADLNKQIADKKAELNQTLADKKAEMETEIANKQAELNQKLADEKAKLDEKLALAGADQAAIDAAYAEFNAEAEKAQAEFDAKAADARAKYAEAKAEAEKKAADAEAEAWKTYDAKCEEAWVIFNDEAGEAAEQARKDVQKAIDEAKADAKEQFEQKFKEEFQKKLDEMEVQLDEAEKAMVRVEAYVAEVNAAVEYYQGVIEDAKQIIVDANALIEDAQETIKVARETIEQARTLVNNVEKTYTELRVAIANPQPSLSYIRETVATLEANYNAAWNALLDLDEDIDNLIVAYDELSKFEIGEINVHRDPIIGFEVGPFEVKADTDGDGVEETYGMGVTKLPTVDLSQYDFYFEGMQMPELPETVNTLDTTLDNIIAKGISLNAALAYYVAAAKQAVAKALDVTVDALGITYNFLKNNLNKEGAVKVYNWLYNNPDKVCAVVKEFGVYGLDLLVQYGPYALDLLEKHSDLAILGMKLTAGGVYLTVTLGAAVLGYVGDRLNFLNDYKADVVNAARKLYAKYGDEAKALVEVYVDYLGLRERYHAATHGEYTIFHDSLYVAIGDSTAAASGSYVDKLADMLQIPHMTENLAQFDLTIEDAIALVGENAELIGKADMITLGFSNIPASFEVMNAIVDEYGNDFTTQVGQTVSKGLDKALAALKQVMMEANVREEYVNMVDEAGVLIENALVALNERLIAEGLDEATINMVMDATEAYAIAYLTRMAWYPCLVDTVRDVNADAPIVIVGTYNDLDGVVLDVNGRNVNIGDYTKYLIAVANLENLVQAFFCDDVIYVNAHNVETVFEENAYEGLNNLGYLEKMLNDEMLPSVAGATYIAEQIFNALDVDYQIWGDVNGDRKVNCRDARLILQYAAGMITENDLDLTWGDVNGDGKVNSRDARLILMLRAGMIEHFPVCGLSEK